MKNFDFKENIEVITKCIETLDKERYEALLFDCENALRKGKKIIVSGLGKNTPVCEKFVSSMLSVGLNAAFLHTSEAFHGDLGMIKNGDVVIVLSKSGKTPESLTLVSLLEKRKDIHRWAFSFMGNTEYVNKFDNAIVLHLEKEGGPWNIMPMNSTIVSLFVLQGLIIDLVNILGITLSDFKANHPGGGIGLKLAQE